MRKYPFPVVNGMVAVEHVNYLLDDRAKLVAALKELVHGVAHLEGTYASYEAYVTAKDVLIELGEMEPRK